MMASVRAAASGCPDQWPGPGGEDEDGSQGGHGDGPHPVYARLGQGVPPVSSRKNAVGRVCEQDALEPLSLSSP
jgi:hypothetical protein